MTLPEMHFWAWAGGMATVQGHLLWAGGGGKVQLCDANTNVLHALVVVEAHRVWEALILALMVHCAKSTQKA